MILSNHKNRLTGFTIIEIMVVVAIIAILAAIAIPNLTRSKISANEASAQSTLKTISTAMENYYVVNSRYPSNTGALISITPPYLNRDYFTGSTNGYTFTSTLTDYTYVITASPVSASTGKTTFTVSTGAVLGSL